MNEYEFINELQQRASEQKRALSSMPLPHLYSIIVSWFGNNPWKLLIPTAIFLSLVLRLFFGTEYTDFILKVFRKL